MTYQQTAARRAELAGLAFSGSEVQEPQPVDQLRQRMEKAIEKLLSVLDALDAVAEDMEEDDDPGGAVDDEGEASLGSVNGQHPTLSQAQWSGGDFLRGKDCDTIDVEAGDSDDEPSLGALEWSTNLEITARDEEGRATGYRLVDGDQTRWGTGNTSDLEDADDELEPDADGEPNLGAPERHPQPYSWSGSEPERCSQALWAQGDGSPDECEREEGECEPENDE